MAEQLARCKCKGGKESANLNHKERWEAVMNCREPDRVPVEPVLFQSASNVTGISATEYYKDARKCADALIAAQKMLGFDSVQVGIHTPQWVELFGGECVYPEHDYPWSKGAVIKDRADLKRMEVPDFARNAPPTIRTMFEAVKILSEEIGDRVAIGAVCTGTFNVAGALRGADQLMLDIALDPDFAHQVADLACRTIIEAGKAYIKSGAQFIWTPDATSSPSCLSPSQYEEFALPRHSRFFSEMKKAGAYTIYHPCGCEYPILCQLKKIEGVDAFNFSNKVDLGIIRQIYGPDQILWGNVDPTGTLLLGNRGDVEREVKGIIEKAGRLGGLVISIGCSMPPTVPLENVKAIVDAAEKHGTYPFI